MSRTNWIGFLIDVVLLCALAGLVVWLVGKPERWADYVIAGAALTALLRSNVLANADGRK